MVLYNMQNLTTKFTRTPDSPELIAQPKKKRGTIEGIKKQYRPDTSRSATSFGRNVVWKKKKRKKNTAT